MTTYRGNIWRLFVVQALSMFILWVPIWVIFLQQKGLSLSQIGVLEAFAWLITAGMEIPTGAIADRWGRKTSIAIGSAVYAASMFLILAEALSPAFLIGYALWNSSFAFMTGADAALLYDSLKGDRREAEAAKMSGRSYAIQQGSQGVAAVIGAALATIDITLCFTICGVLALVGGALILTVKEPPRYEEGEERLGYWKNLRTAIALAARRPLVRALVLMSAAFAVIPLIVYYFLLQPYAIAVGLPVVLLGVVVVSIQGATVAASWLAHRAERFDPVTVVSGAVVLFAVATVLLGLIPSVPAIALMLVVALAPAVVTPLLQARLNDCVPSAQRATVISMGALLTELGTAGAVPLLMWLADMIGPAEAVGLAAVLFAVVTVPLLVVWNNARPAAPVATAPTPAGA